MFKFLKEKLNKAISKITKKVEEEVVETIEKKAIEEPKGIEQQKLKEEKPEIKKIQKERFKEKEAVKEEPTTKEPKEEIEKQKLEAPKSEEGFFKKLFKKKEETVTEKKEQAKEEQKETFLQKITKKITTTRINENRFNELFWDLETALLENNVAYEVIDKIKNDLKNDLTNKEIKRSEIEKEIKKGLKESIESLFEVQQIDLEKALHSKKPFIICFFGINGSGKTTTISKFVAMLKNKNLKSILAASDTFRASAIEQLEEHGKRLGVKVIKHGYGSDPAAVAYDAIEHAKSKNIDVVLIDTAGRLQSNKNLMEEMKKIIKVAKPDLKIFVGESITGNDCIEQSKSFNDSVGIDAIILTKADVDEKGGTAISISYVTNKPILFLGIGQDLNDLRPFNRQEIISSLGLN